MIGENSGREDEEVPSGIIVVAFFWGDSVARVDAHDQISIIRVSAVSFSP
jgi:hypothetical protein